MNHAKDDRVWNTLNRSSGDIAFVLRSLANSKRLQLLTSLLRGPKTFSALQKVTGLRKTALAHHLRILVKAGILDAASVQEAAVHSGVVSAALALTIDVLIHHKKPKQAMDTA